MSRYYGYAMFEDKVKPPPSLLREEMLRLEIEQLRERIRELEEELYGR